MTSAGPPDEWQYEPPGSRRARRKRRKLILVGSALAAILVALAVLVAVQVTDQRDAVDLPTAGPPTATATLGEPVQDGQIEFLVESIEPMVVSPGPPPVSVQVVTVRVTNKGDSPHYVAIDDQVVIGDQGHKYHPDPLISENLNKDQGDISLEPGATEAMRLPVNFPPDARPTAVVLHAGAFTAGVEVNLAK